MLSRLLKCELIIILTWILADLYEGYFSKIVKRVYSSEIVQNVIAASKQVIDIYLQKVELFYKNQSKNMFSMWEEPPLTLTQQFWKYYESLFGRNDDYYSACSLCSFWKPIECLRNMVNNTGQLRVCCITW